MATIPAFSAPDWLKTETAEQIQARMMESLPPDIDDTEGGFPWDFTYPTALEKDELLNFHLVETLKLMFQAWSYGAYLDGHARADGLSRRPANPAAGIVTFTGTPGTQIPEGTVVCVPSSGGVPAIEYATDSVAYIGEATGGEDGTVDVAITAVEPGPTGNVGAGAITIMMDPIAGVTLVTNADKITGGAEEEDDESLRLRIAEYDETSGESFVGCDADYYITAKADSLVKYNEIHAALTRTEGVKNFSKILVNGDVKDIPLDPADYPCTGEIHGIKDTEATSE